MRRLAIPALAVLVALGAAACSGDPGTGDFKSEAEEYIEGDLADAPELAGALSFSDASCEEPTATDIGTTYDCTATGSDGVAYTLTVSITGENELTVSGIDPPLSIDAPTATTTG
ncbi:MAG: hypothetical protein ABW328_14910 [Ilumatobacteraceae bacterium]